MGVTILTGPVRTGKTTRLLEWARACGRVAGVAQPAGPEGRVFEDVSTGDRMALEPVGPGEAAQEVGRFRFRSEAFEWAEARLRAALAVGASMILIDEVGPLELAGAGLRRSVDAAVAEHRGTLLLVVREALAERVRAEIAPHARIVPATAWPQVGQEDMGAP